MSVRAILQWFGYVPVKALELAEDRYALAGKGRSQTDELRANIITLGQEVGRLTGLLTRESGRVTELSKANDTLIQRMKAMKVREQPVDPSQEPTLREMLFDARGYVSILRAELMARGVAPDDLPKSPGVLYVVNRDEDIVLAEPEVAVAVGAVHQPAMSVENDDGPALIVVCRDIPGDHVGGPECFCSPLTFTVDTPTDQITAAMESAELRN